MKIILSAIMVFISAQAVANEMVRCDLATPTIGGSLNQSILFVSDESAPTTEVRVHTSNYDMMTGDATEVNMTQPGFECQFLMVETDPQQLTSGRCSREINGVETVIEIEPSQEGHFTLIYNDDSSSSNRVPLEYSCQVM